MFDRHVAINHSENGVYPIVVASIATLMALYSARAQRLVIESHNEITGTEKSIILALRLENHQGIIM